MKSGVGAGARDSYQHNKTDTTPHCKVAEAASWQDKTMNDACASLGGNTMGDAGTRPLVNILH